MQTLFVYGTLRQGYRAHNALMGDAKFIGPATIQAERLGVSHFKSSNAWALNGELYEIPDTSMLALDDYEGHPTLYERALTPVRYVDNGVTKTGEAWVYHYRGNKHRE